MEFVINLALNGNEAAADLKRVADKADDAGERMAALEKRAHMAGTQIGEGMKAGIKSLVAMGVAAAGAGVALFKLAQSTADEIDEMGDFADKNNIGIEALQEWGYAAQKAGASPEAFKASVSGLNKVIGEAALGVGKGAKMMDKFGISAKNADGSVKSTEQVIGEISKKMEALSRQEAIAMASKLGIDTDLVPLLQSGAKNIDQLLFKARQLGVVTEEQADKTAEFTSQMEDMNQSFGYLKAVVGSEVAPVISDLIKQFIDSQGGIEGLKGKAQEFAERLKAILPQIAKVAAAFGTIVVAGANVLDWLAQVTGGWDNLAYAMIGFKALSAGGLVGPLLDGLSNVATTIGSKLIPVFMTLGRIILMNPIGLVLTAIAAAAFVIYKNWDTIVAFIKKAWQGVGDFFSGVLDKMMGWWNAFKDTLISGINWVIDKMNYLPGVNIDQVGGGGAAASTATPATSASSPYSKSMVQNITVNATTKQAVDRAVSPDFARQTATAAFGGTF
ncbi:hypothetical protein [Formosimonas limnophila]|nr:hypothetical protein [Formosimonas limnophila]